MNANFLNPEGEGNVTTCKIFINDVEMSANFQLVNLSVDVRFNKIASAQLSFLDGSVADQDFETSNTDSLKPGNKIKILLGSDVSLAPVFEGILIKHSLKIKSNGRSFLLVEAKDKAIILIDARKSKYFIEKKDSEVFEEIIAGADLPFEIDPTHAVKKQIVQFNSTDWDFIVTRAEQCSMFVLTKLGKIRIQHPRTNQEPVYTVSFGNNLINFDGEMDTRRQINQVTASSWDYTQQHLETSDPGEADFQENGNLSSEELGEVLKAKKTLNSSASMNAEELKDWADAYAFKSKIGKSVGRFQILGQNLWPGDMVQLDGVGDRFNGTVLVTGVLHVFDGTWHSDVQFGWKEDWFFKKEDVMEQPASGLVPAISGLQIGVVVEAEDDQDGGQYRMKIHIPTITLTNEGIWARVATLDAGDQRGVYFRPEIGDEVVLGFLNDDPQQPVVLGGLHSKGNKKSPLPQTEGNKEYGIVTGADSKLIFDDTNKMITLSVSATNGEKSLLLNDSGSIILKDGFGNKLSMDSGGIQIESQGTIKINGTLIQIN